MLESRRRAYLEAMGIPCWLRRARSPEPSAPPEQAVATPIAATASRHTSPTVMLERTATPAATAAEDAGRIPTADTLTGLGWDDLAAQVAACRACALCQSRTQTVFGVGSRDADLMLIGEAPGAEEDRQGKPFVGRAGKLLDAMLQAIGLGREQVYIANILKCRPPGNRNPSVEEALACEGYLRRQIELVQPKLILSLGGVSAHNLLKTDEAVGRLRRQPRQLPGADVAVRVTYHPAYLLRRPEEKAKAWEDLQAVARELAAARAEP